MDHHSWSGTETKNLWLAQSFKKCIHPWTKTHMHRCSFHFHGLLYWQEQNLKCRSLRIESSVKINLRNCSWSNFLIATWNFGLPHPYSTQRSRLMQPTVSTLDTKVKMLMNISEGTQWFLSLGRGQICSINKHFHYRSLYLTYSFPYLGYSRK